MTLEEMEASFEEAVNRTSNWELNDLDGFLHLLKLGWTNPGSTIKGIQSKKDLISAAEHDQIWLDVNMKWLCEVVTIDDINYLSDCGIHYDSEYESLYMFV